MLYSQRKSPGSRRLLLLLLLLAAWEAGSGQLHYSVPEEAPHGTFVGRIAQDLGLEPAELVPRLFRVASRERGDLLEVNLQNGILFVNSRLDREELCGRSAECSLHLEVIVDRPLQVFHVEVEVRDVNDNPPVFPATQKNLFIPESRLLDSRLPLEGASDADIGANALLTYRLSPNEYFSLDVPANDEQVKPLGLVLRKPLDREEAPELYLWLTATDGGKPELTGTVQLLITVLDANDNAPAFGRTLYTARLSENVPIGTMVIPLNASDLDEGVNGEIMYSFSSDASPDVKSKFHIDSVGGDIAVIGDIDYEERKAYKIQVEASDKGFPPLAGHCTVLVEVLDMNDNAPQLTLTSLSLLISEDTQPGTVVTLLNVFDRDSGNNGQVTCSLSPDTPFKLVSTFKNYYSLVLESSLDRESVSAYQVVVTARDGGSPPLWATASVSVEVADVNDNAPTFAQAEYTVFVKENNAPGSHIFTVRAWDADAQENARVSYALVERRVGERALSSYVSVHAESGKVHALQPLDREELELLRFQVSARDAGVPALGSNVTLQVFVLDENDNAPALLAPAGGGALSEALWRSAGVGHVVTKVRAVDADSGYNAWLSYELQPPAGADGARSPFRVGLYTGEISTTRALDEADAPRQRLLVLVKDHGEPALTATATVLVSLVDSGQEPKTSRVSLGVVGPEASLVDVNVYLIVAICAVSSLLVLTLVLYVALRCWGSPTQGACAPGKPVLVCSSAVGSWSYSQQRRQRVCSGEGPPKTDLMAFSPSLPQGPTSTTDSRQDLLRRAKGILDMVITWQRGPETRRLLLSLLLLAAWEAGSGQLRYSVPEEAPHGTFVGRIAQDLGLEPAELVPRLFQVASRERGDLLEVNLQNGILFVNSRLDREELCGRSAECSLHLEVIVDRPLQVFHVEVEVRDVNDNPPVFSLKEQKLFISESRVLDSRFLLEGASDADIGANSLLTYVLHSNDYFTLNVNSKNKENKQLELVLRKSLDREDVPEHSLLLMATDGGKPELTGSLQVLVTVLDVNDNAPSFEQSEYEVRIFENADNGTMVIRVNASDCDEGANGEVSYSFNSLVPPVVMEKFSIDANTGAIEIRGNLDFEQKTLYKIRVDATDSGHPPMAGHCTVLVKVLDRNDNAPRVALTSLSLPVQEDAQLGTIIALISVSDLDSGVNGQVTCSLTPSVPFKLVSTFKNHYSLVLDSALDRESVSAYEVVVTARDGGSPPLWATASVSVEVADVNDNAPTFAQAEYTVFVKENNAPGSHIFTVRARDADAQDNARVSYALVERRVGERALSSYVSVHAESGKVHALQPLDREELELLRFQVSARDAGVPALGSNVTLQVFVLDENDNAPALLAPARGGALSEALWRSAGAGHVVTKVRAVDADSGYNAWLSYELQPPAGADGARSPFRVGLYTGEISTTRALDEADAPRQRLLVLVKDHGEPALTATATVLVSLVDSGQEPKTSRVSLGVVGPEASLVDVNVYLIVAICAVSSLLVLTLVLYVALRCWGSPTQGACAPGKPVLVCSSAVGSWSYSQQRRQRVCSGEGPPKTDLMAFSPGLPPCPGSADGLREPCTFLDSAAKPRQSNPDWRYSASLRAGMHSSVHLEEAGILRAGPGGPDQQWPTVSSATPEPEAGEVSPPVGAGVNSNSWTFKYGPGNPKQSGPGELPDKFIIPGSPAIISIRQEPSNSQIDKSDFITFGKKEETKKKKKKKKGNKTQEKKEKGNSTTDNSDQ
ncbi:protocadherin alpha-8 isoform 1-T1 [Thomomys bottae]